MFQRYIQTLMIVLFCSSSVLLIEYIIFQIFANLALQRKPIYAKFLIHLFVFKYKVLTDSNNKTIKIYRLKITGNAFFIEWCET